MPIKSKDEKALEFWGQFISDLEKKGIIKEEGKDKLAKIMLILCGVRAETEGETDDP